MREIIGYSESGQPLTVSMFRETDANVKVLVLAGQHGDEVLARAAVAELDRFVQEGHCELTNLELAIIGDINPDGTIVGSRCNANSIDLNRDHQLLSAPETRALHSFVRRWVPQLVIDVHTYPPRRKHLLGQGLVYCHDMFIDVPSNPSLCPDLIHSKSDSLVDHITQGLANQGFRTDRYTLFRPNGRVRHGTPDVVDARNGLALRYGVQTLLLEGRQPGRGEGELKATRTVATLRSALLLALDWAVQHCDHLSSPSRIPNRNDSVGIRSKYCLGNPRTSMRFQDLVGRLCTVELGTKYTPFVKSTKSIQLPQAYAIPKHLDRLHSLLQIHGFRNTLRVPDGQTTVEEYSCTKVVPSWRKNRSPRQVSTVLRRVVVDLSDYVLYPVDQIGGRALPVFLEPESKYGLVRVRSLGLALNKDMPYPVLRVQGL